MKFRTIALATALALLSTAASGADAATETLGTRNANGFGKRHPLKRDEIYLSIIPR